MDLIEVADELYGLPLEQFIECRNARAEELVACGDKETAAEVRKLQKPSRAAWLANRIVRRHPKEIESVLGLGRDLRHAQDHAQGADLRRLSTNRQDLVQIVLRLAADEAAKTAGASFSADVQRQLVATFEAAMANESSGVALKSGRLTGALSHVGFGVAQTTEPTHPARRRQTKGSGSQIVGRDRRRVALDEAEEALADARARLTTANRVVDQAIQRHELAKARQREVADELRSIERAVNETADDLQKATMRQKGAAKRVRIAEERHRHSAVAR